MASADDIDALYGLPLDEFTQARNDLARRLRRAEARRGRGVAGLRKPTLPHGSSTSSCASAPGESVRSSPARERDRQGRRTAMRGSAERRPARAQGTGDPRRRRREGVGPRRPGGRDDAPDRRGDGTGGTRDGPPHRGPRGEWVRRARRGAPRRRETKPRQDEARRPSIDRAAVDAARKALSTRATRHASSSGQRSPRSARPSAPGLRTSARRRAWPRPISTRRRASRRALAPSPTRGVCAALPG